MLEAGAGLVRADAVQDAAVSGATTIAMPSPTAVRRKDRNRKGRARFAGSQQNVTRRGDEPPDRQREARSHAVGQLSREARRSERSTMSGSTAAPAAVGV